MRPPRGWQTTRQKSSPPRRIRAWILGIPHPPRPREHAGGSCGVKSIPAETEAPPGLARRASVEKDPTSPEEAEVERQGEPTPEPPVDQEEPKAPSPTDSELIREMEDMLEG
ncbi:hypothetical protein ACLKA6_001441 [Drosophila palustris]